MPCRASTATPSSRCGAGSTGSGATPLPQRPLPHQVRGIVQTLAEFQRLAAYAAWHGTRADAVRALVAHPFVRSLAVAEELYDELAYANRDYLPERLLA
ncbi:family 4 glycosyl hydrolase [Nostocoides japonicum]|uniref:family 4 glycosyl hydrolase n=1 Tax=Nostocoides japonicum TaxID=99481 RepID=UPI0038991D25